MGSCCGRFGTMAGSIAARQNWSKSRFVNRSNGQSGCLRYAPVCSGNSRLSGAEAMMEALLQRNSSQEVDGADYIMHFVVGHSFVHGEGCRSGCHLLFGQMRLSYLQLGLRCLYVFTACMCTYLYIHLVYFCSSSQICPAKMLLPPI